MKFLNLIDCHFKTHEQLAILRPIIDKKSLKVMIWAVFCFFRNFEKSEHADFIGFGNLEIFEHLAGMT